MNKLCFSILLFIIAACGHPRYKYPHVLINTRLGDIEVELYTDKAPKSTAAFLSYVDSGIYRNISFYRVLKAEEMPTDLNSGIIQGGIYMSRSNWVGKVKPVPHEPTSLTGLSHTNGIVSFARIKQGDPKTEFFICIGDQSSLDAGKGATDDDAGFAAFGKVFKGMDVVRKIQNQPSHGDMFNERVDILDIQRL